MAGSTPTRPDPGQKRDRNFSMRLPSEMLEQLRELAREDQRSVAQYLRVLIAREFDRLQAEKKKGRQR